MNSEFSRRKAEELIMEGKVSLNGVIIKKLGTQIDPLKDTVEIDGMLIQKTDQKLYLMMNKPAGFTCTRAHFYNEKSVMDLVKQKNVYPVGRLDKDTKGLLLLTNDGDFAYKITHPKFEHEKEYTVLIKNFLSPGQKSALEKGIMIDFKKTAPCKISNIKKTRDGTVLNIIIHEGRKRQIRRMFEKINNPVLELKRVRISKILLGNLSEGKVRFLTADEIKSIN